MAAAPVLSFRLATQADADIVRDVVRAAYARWVAVIGREPRPMLADYAIAVREHQIELALSDGAVAGLIEMMLRDDHLWIENIAVLPERQGQGIGRQLLVRAKVCASRLGRRECRLLTNGAFEANVVLYESIGYTITQREAFMGGTTVYMRKHV